MTRTQSFAHVVRVVRFREPRSVVCLCGWRARADTDRELEGAWKQHRRDVNVPVLSLSTTIGARIKPRRVPDSAHIWNRSTLPPRRAKETVG